MPRAAEIQNLIVILTAQCDMRCSYCYQNAKKARSMDWNTLRAALDLVLGSASGELQIVFVGGEPLLEFPKIRRAVAHVGRNAAAGRGIKFAISTNGLLLTDEVADFLGTHGFEIQLSFDGVEQAQNYRRKGTFSRLDRLLDRIHERNAELLRTNICVGPVLIPDTIPYLADSAAYFIEKGVKHLDFCPCFTPAPGWTRGRIQELDAQFRRIYEHSLRHLEKTGDVPLTLFRKSACGRNPRRKDGGMCRATGGANLTVDVDGQAYGCVMFAESYQEFPSQSLKTRLAPLRMGDIRDPGFRKRYAGYPDAVRNAEIFHHKERKYSSYGRCRDCPYLDRCYVCPVSIGYEPANDDPHKVPDFLCAYNRVALQYRDRFPPMPDVRQRLETLLRAGHR